ncbi:hypothetical protein [Burkholderia sp. PR2]|uniref:hypothetical protein n=1 Tax=Burkholderia sp. PR2 TaxID=3448078 RepID=UPI00402AFF04
MFVTNATWAEHDVAKQQLVMPDQAWDCVEWTDETLSFLVLPAGNRLPYTSLPAGWLLAGVHVLLEAISEQEQDGYLVYVLDRPADGIGLHLHQVAGIWRERESNPVNKPWRWYSTHYGELKPCTRTGRHCSSPPELVSERRFAASAVVAG